MATPRVGFWTWIWPTRYYCGLRQDVVILFSGRKTQLVSIERLNNCGAIDVKMLMSIVDVKSSFKMLGVPFSYKSDWDAYIVSILLKLPPRKLKPWLALWSFFHLKLLLIYKSTIQLCMEYCCHVRTDTTNYYWDYAG